MLPQVVIEAMRSGVPIVGAMAGPAIANKRGMSTGTVKAYAGYAFLGWLAGYTLQKSVFWALDTLGQSKLPTEVASLKGLAAVPQIPEAAPEPTKAPEKSRAGQVEAEARNDGVQVLEESDNVVPMKIQSHMTEAYGSEL